MGAPRISPSGRQRTRGARPRWAAGVVRTEPDRTVHRLPGGPAPLGSPPAARSAGRRWGALFRQVASAAPAIAKGAAVARSLGERLDLAFFEADHRHLLEAGRCRPGTARRRAPRRRLVVKRPHLRNNRGSGKMKGAASSSTVVQERAAAQQRSASTRFAPGVAVGRSAARRRTTARLAVTPSSLWN